MYKPVLAIIALVVIPILPTQPLWLDPWLLTLEPTPDRVLGPPLPVAQGNATPQILKERLAKTGYRFLIIMHALGRIYHS